MAIDPQTITTAYNAWHALLSWPYWKLPGGFAVGFLGSGAYITALNFKFIGADDAQRAIVMEPFLQRYSMGKIHGWKCVWYCSIGGLIAVVFQFDVPNFVAVQNLILGATWPAIISQFLSGRMVSPSLDELKGLAKPPEPMSQEIKKKLKELEKKISKTV